MANDSAEADRCISPTWYCVHVVRWTGCITILAVFLLGKSWADISATVRFTNGDRLTGAVVNVDTSEVRFRADALGTVLTLHWQGESLGELDLKQGCVYRESGVKLCFHSAVVRLSRDNTVSITTESGKMKSGIMSLGPTPPTPAPPAAMRQVAPQSAERSLETETASASSEKTVSMWSLGLNGPESVINATQSSQSLGGSLVNNLYFGDPNHLIISAAGTHQHNYSQGKSIKTDVFDSFVQFGRTLGKDQSDQFTLYGIGEWFFNTSLGLAAQRSGGAGVFFPTLRSKSENFSFQAKADLRYFSERLYGGHPVLDLVGSRFQTQAVYTASDRSWSILSVAWINPMWNNEGAWQGYGNLTLSLPFGKHVCLDFTPASDDYLENAPHGNRQNYLSSTATLKIIAGPNPSQICTQQ